MFLKVLILFAFPGLLVTAVSAQTGKEAELFLNRYKEFLYKTDSTYQSYTYNSTLLSDSGRWADVNYADDHLFKCQFYISL